MEQNTEKYNFLDILGVTNLWNKIKSNFVRNKSTTVNKINIDDKIVIVNGKNELDIVSNNMYFLSYDTINFQGMSNEPGIQLIQNYAGYFDINIKNSKINIDKNSSIKGIKLTSNDLYYTYIRENSWLKDIEQYLVIMNNFDGDILPTIYITATAIDRTINFPLALYTTVNSQIVKICNIFPYDLDNERNYIYRGVFSFRDMSDEIGEIYIDKDYEITANDKQSINQYTNWVKNTTNYITTASEITTNKCSIDFNAPDGSYTYDIPLATDTTAGVITGTQHKVINSLTVPPTDIDTDVNHPFREDSAAIDMSVDLVANIGNNNIWCLTCQLTDQENQELQISYIGKVISTKTFYYTANSLNMYNWFVIVPSDAPKNSAIIDYR